MTEMMRDRRAVRYLVAPAGFGKTQLAAGYAEAVFDFESVFWIAAESPCFLRDLDDETLADSLLAAAQRPSLVVFDDVPALDDRRATAFDAALSRIIDAGWEVVVCADACDDPLAAFREGYLCIDADGMLYDGADLVELRRSDPRLASIAEPDHRVFRIPALATHAPGSVEAFFSKLLTHGCGFDAAAIVFVGLMLEHGTPDDIDTVLGARPGSTTAILASSSATGLYVGYDPLCSAFSAPALPIREVIRAFTPYLHRIADGGAHDDPNGFIRALIEKLCRRHSIERAGALLLSVCTPEQRACWLDEHDVDSLVRCYPSTAQMVFESLPLGSMREGGSRALFAALRLCLLGEVKRGKTLIARHGTSVEADADVAGLIDAIAKMDESRPDLVDAATGAIIDFAASQMNDPAETDAFRTRLVAERAAYARMNALRCAGVAGVSETGLSALRAHGAAKRAAACDLQVVTLGGFEVKLRGLPVPGREMYRRKTVELFAILLINRGRDLSCSRLASLLWPEATPFAARNSFYTLYSVLRRCLSDEDGVCRHLHRRNGICRLERESLRCDLDEAAELCHRLSVERLEADQAVNILDRLVEVYRGDFIPGESNVAAIVAARREWRDRVVDAVLSAAIRLESEGKTAAALHLARQAHSWDERREDVYGSIIRFQLNAGQRPSALDTWFAYRDFCVNDLGLDPSEHAVGLYQRIIGVETEDDRPPRDPKVMKVQA